MGHPIFHFECGSFPQKPVVKSSGFSNEPFSDAASNAFRDENASHIHHSCTPIFFPRMKKIRYVMK